MVNSTTTTLVQHVKPGVEDFAGSEIVCVYSYNPPDYAVYRTPIRVMVHFADDRELGRMQRAQIACLTPLRGQINALIDGWNSTKDTLLGRRRKEESPLRKRALRYDRRVADALVVGLENDTATALSLLAEIKNDIINERTSMARTDYLVFALVLVVVFIGATSILASSFVGAAAQLPREADAVWTAVCGGALGAFFSIAIGLKGRTVLIDLQNRDNIADASLRMLIGAISGGMLLCLLVSGLISNVIDISQLTSGSIDYKHLLVFVIGFLAGFFERLVPDLLSQTNLGTTESSGGPTGTPGSSGPAPVPPPPPGGGRAVERTGPSPSPKTSSIG